MSLALTDAIVLITSSDPQNDRFGTGFIIRQAGDFTYVITCAHVVDDVGIETLCIKDIPGTVVVTGDDLGLDLAVVKVDGLFNADQVFAVGESRAIRASRGQVNATGFMTEGFQIFDSRAKTYRKRALRGTVAESFHITAQSPNHSIQAWELEFDDGSVQPGYSGSPVVDAQTGNVVGVISHRLREGLGAAIAIEELNRIWQPIERHHLKETLLRLGYRDQARLFRQSVEKKPIGAYLIHGPTVYYGQQWLVNRLLQQHVRSSMNAKKFRISLNRLGRRVDVQGLWTELALELKCDRHTPPKEIAKRALRWWRSQDLIIAIYDVDCLSEELLNLLIQEFWLPLANEAEGMRTQGNSHKLLMFLIDHEAVTAQRNVPFTAKIDADSKTYYPVKSPQNREFSKDELTDWMEDHRSQLPKEMTDQTDQTVDRMYEMSDSGVPEWAFVEICKRCGYDWRTESAGWFSI